MKWKRTVGHDECRLSDDYERFNSVWFSFLRNNAHKPVWARPSFLFIFSVKSNAAAAAADNKLIHYQSSLKFELFIRLSIISQVCSVFKLNIYFRGHEYVFDMSHHQFSKVFAFSLEKRDLQQWNYCKIYDLNFYFLSFTFLST